VTMEAPPVGILSGISYVSGMDYYKGVNEQYAALVGKRQLMPPNPLMLMASVDCDVVRGCNLLITTMTPCSPSKRGPAR
jgi:hypothetical protein